MIFTLSKFLYAGNYLVIVKNIFASDYRLNARIIPVLAIEHDNNWNWNVHLCKVFWRDKVSV